MTASTHNKTSSKEGEAHKPSSKYKHHHRNVSFGGEVLSSREVNDVMNGGNGMSVTTTKTDVVISTTIDEHILTSSGRNRQQHRQQQQLRSPPPPPSISEGSTSPSLLPRKNTRQEELLSKMEVEENKIKMAHKRKASMSTPNLQKMNNDEYEYEYEYNINGSGSGPAATSAAAATATDATIATANNTTTNHLLTASAVFPITPSATTNATTTATHTTTMTRSVSTSNIRGMKRSKSELILLSPEFRTRLMREQNERDPLFYYEVKKTIGTGSMGSVALVKKRSQTVGGSARRNVREAVRTHKRKQKCFQLPFGIGGLFRLCIEDELRVEEEDDEDGTGPNNKGKRRGRKNNSKNALLSIETWLGSSSGSSSGVSSSASSSSSSSNNISKREKNPKVLTHLQSSILFPASEGDGDNDDNDDRISSSSSSRPAVHHEYAMKSIHLSRVTDDTFVKELKNEIAILKKLDHPHIVRPLETYHYKHQIFIVMEHCSGGDLYSRDPYTEEEAARIISSMLSAVAYLHSNNVAHRDLKYENILFVNESPKAEIKLIDFGLSKVYGLGGVGPGATQTLTEGVGTIYTMAPEVLKGSYTKQADVWSVGVIAYMLLSSQMPFYGRKRQHIVEQILGGKYDFRGRRWRKIGTPAKYFVRDLLVVDPDERLDAERASSCVWLNKRFAATVRGPRESEIRQAKNSMTRYAGYTKLKKMALMIVAHRSTCEEIGILRKVFQKYASHNKGGCISYEEFRDAWKESGLPPEDTKAVFDAVDLDGSGRIRYTEFLAATIEAQGAISEERLAEAFDRFDSDDSGYISVDNLAEILGKDFPRQEIIDIIGDAVDPNNDRDGSSRISYSAFLSLWEKNHEKEAHESKLRMLGSQANLGALVAGGGGDDSCHSADDSEEAAKARATFLMNKHGTLGNTGGPVSSGASSEQVVIGKDTMIAISTGNLLQQKIVEDNDGEDDFSMDGGIEI